MTESSGGNSTDCPWFQLLAADDTSLQQGDVFRSFSIVQIKPPFDAPDILNASWEDFNIVILSQTCDLLNGKIDNVLICPVFELEELAPRLPQLSLDVRKNKDKLERGEFPSLHVIPPCKLEKFASPPLLVNFRQVWAVPLLMVQSHAGRAEERVRLLPPYREHLAQAFGRFVMRVGLPLNYALP